MKSLIPFLFLAFSIFCPAGNCAEPSKNRPNILFIAVDDLNHWVGYTKRNSQSLTPNIDRLSALGTSFTNAHCTAPACNPSRASLMSGMRPGTTGCYLNSDPWKNHIPVGKGLSQTFRNAGYNAFGVGKIYHSNTFYKSEWDEYPKMPATQNGANDVAKDEGFHIPLAHDLKDSDLNDWHAVDYCIKKLNQKHDKPFFLACGLYKPHLPWAVPRKYYEKFPLESIKLPPHQKDDLKDIPPAGVKMARPEGDHARFRKSGRWKAAIQSYLACCAYTDMNIGRLLDAYEKSPHRENSIIVFWTDHGWHLGEKQHWRKFSLWEEATRTPLIFVVSGLTKPSTICDRSVDLLNIYPTLCELANIAKPEHLEGHSMKTLLKKPESDWDRAAICTHGFKNHAIRDQDWRYIQYADGSEELYNHADDPYEFKNLASNEAFESRKLALRKHLPTVNAPASRKKSKKKK